MFSVQGNSVFDSRVKTVDSFQLQFNPLAENLRMNQQCKVCGEPAAGFHFGAFTCEGCKSFFGRSYNNLSSISECKNNGGCVINKKNRTSCKACRLRKCLMVGMSKSGSRYGRRSNWFKIHCLLQEQQQQQQQSYHQQQPQQSYHKQQEQQQEQQQQQQQQQKSPSWDTHPVLGLMNHPYPRLQQFLSQQQAMVARSKEDSDDYKHSTSPSISSPESHNSDSSVEVSDARLRANFFPRPPDAMKDSLAYLPFGFPPAFTFPPMFPPNYLYKPTPMLKPPNNNNDNDLEPVDMFNKRFFLDAVLQSQRIKEEDVDDEFDEDEDEDEERPIDLSMKSCSLIRESKLTSDEDITDEEIEEDDEHEVVRDEVKELRSVPMDLTAKV